MKQSREYSLMEYLFFNSGRSKEDIAEDLFISTSTLSRMIDRINRLLSAQQISILSGPYRVEGDEMMISQFYIAFFSELYSHGCSLMESEEQDLLLTLYESIVGEERSALNYLDAARISIWTFVRIKRIRNGYGNPYRLEKVHEAEALILNDIAFSDKFESVFELKLNKKICSELYSMFCHPRFTIELSGSKGIPACTQEQSELYSNINELVKNVAISLGIASLNTESLKNVLFNIIQFPLNPPYFLYNKYKVFADSFSCGHQKVAAAIREQVKRTINRQISEDEVNAVFYILVTRWPGLIVKLEESSPEVVLGIFCDSDIAHSQIICEITKLYSNINLKLLLPDIINDLDSLCSEIDLLITDIPILKASCNEIICIREYPTPQDWQNIIFALKRTYQRKRHMFYGDTVVPYYKCRTT